MKRLAAVALLAVVFLVTCQKTETQSTTSSAPPPSTSAVAPASVQYVAINPSVFVPSATIEGWINAKPIDQSAIDAHRWAIWQGMTASSGQSLNGTPLPVWETWYDTTTVFANAKLPQTATAAVKGARLADLTPVNERRRFNRPVQLVKHAVKRKTLTGAELSGIVLAFNRFTQDMRDHIWMNKYYDSDVLTALNTKFNNDKTPIADRQIAQFPDHSIVLKPVFWLADATTPTIMPYWNGTGTGATTNPTNPTPDTWQQCVLLDPTGKATNQNPIACNGKQIAGGQYKVVPISGDPSKSGLYAFKLTQAEADELNTLLGNDVGLLYGIQPPLQAGDFAIFVAMHCATREITNWTWQTFWYEPDPASLPSQPPMAQAAPTSISTPWNSYVSCTAYYMVTPPNDPKGAQHLCYNPYLETALSGLDNKDQSSTSGVGVQTNCMTCHRAAVWNPTNDNPPYAIDFFLDPANPTWFANVTKTEFSWATQSNAHTAPFEPPPGK
jgi:hypothetical protein